jgi:hypothetical protein
VATYYAFGRAYLIASTLCSGKSCQDDWSKPGGIYQAEFPPSIQGEADWRFLPICDGLSKNHGLDKAVLDRGRRGFLVSAHEGLFFLVGPDKASGRWMRETISEGEYSDAFVFSGDDPADPQVFSLSPFHGNVLSRHRQTAFGWSRETLDDTIEFGHVLWAGIILGRRGLLVGERGGSKLLAIYRLDGGNLLEKQPLDAGVGPTQAVVVERGGGEAAVFVAAHARGEVIEYALTV